MRDRPIFILTLHQPYASLMAAGLKSIETRSWRTSWQGLVAIHAGKSEDPGEGYLRAKMIGLISRAQRLPFGWSTDRLQPPSRGVLPLGAIVAVGELRECERTEFLLHLVTGTPEMQFGDYSAGRFGWMFDRIVPLPKPLIYRGVQGIRELTDEPTVAALRDVYANEPASFTAAMISTAAPPSASPAFNLGMIP